MVCSLRLAVWNANGLSRHSHELKQFLSIHNIDVMMISETHFTEKSHLKLHRYKIYHTMHPSDKARGGSAIIVREAIKHYEHNKYQKEHIQATTIIIEEQNRKLALSAVYCPPGSTIQKEQFEHYFNSLGHRFIAGGDYNAKHPLWGSRLLTPRGRQLYNTLTASNLSFLSSGEPTYWPTDRAKIPDLLDFCVTKGYSTKYATVKSCFDLTSDHSPIIVNVFAQVTPKITQSSLTNNRTNWNLFRTILNDKINLNIELKTPDQLEEAVEYLNNLIHEAAWQTTPEITSIQNEEKCPPTIREKI